MQEGNPQILLVAKLFILMGFIATVFVCRR